MYFFVHTVCAHVHKCEYVSTSWGILPSLSSTSHIWHFNTDVLYISLRFNRSFVVPQQQLMLHYVNKDMCMNARRQCHKMDVLQWHKMTFEHLCGMECMEIEILTRMCTPPTMNVIHYEQLPYFPQHNRAQRSCSQVIAPPAVECKLSPHWTTPLSLHCYSCWSASTRTGCRWPAE